MENIKFPKVLIISHNALSKRFNNGSTILSLFKFWPEENLAQIYFRKETPALTTYPLPYI